MSQLLDSSAHKKATTSKTITIQKFFCSPAGAGKQEEIAYPNQPFTQDQLLDDEALRCLLYTAHRTGVDTKEIMSFIVRDWYDLFGCDISPSFLKTQIAWAKAEDAS